MKKLLTITLTLAMLLGMFNTAYAATFADVPESHWAFSSIKAMAEQNIVEGIGNDMFGPENKVSGKEFTAMVVRSLGSNLVNEYQEEADGSDWAAPYLAAAKDCGLLNNLSVSDSPMSRADMATMIYNYFVYKRDKQMLPEEYKTLVLPTDEALAKVKIPDIGDLSAEQQKYIKTVYSLGLLRGVDSSGNFAPEDTLTRAQAARALNVTTSMMELKSHVPSSVPEDVRYVYNLGEDNIEWIQAQLETIITDKMSDKKKATAIAYFLCDYMTYDLDYYLNGAARKATIEEGAPSFSEPYGVCADYANRYKAFCLLAGLDCEYITGTARGMKGMGSHAWNRVQCDGDWYYVDVTWLDDDKDDTYDNVYLLQKDYWTTHKTEDGRYGMLYADSYHEDIYDMAELLSRCTVYEIEDAYTEITVHVGDSFDFSLDGDYAVHSIANSACVASVGDVITKDGSLHPCYIAKSVGKAEAKFWETEDTDTDREGPRENPDVYIVINVVR